MAGRSFGREHLSHTVRINSIRRGLLGGSSFWLFVFVVRLVGGKFREVSKRGEKPIRFSESLAVGEGLVIRHIDPRGQGS